MIHENVCESQKTNSISFAAEVLWFRILTKVDDNGNFYRDPRVVFPSCVLDKKGATQALVEKWLKELIRIGLICEFEAEGRKYLHVTDFEKYQDLRLDGYASIKYPIHPPELGQGYTGKGRRSTVLRTAEEPKNPVNIQSQSGSSSVTPRRDALEVEVELESEVEIEPEVEGEGEGEFAPSEFFLTPQNQKTIKTVFRDVTGVKAVITSRTAEDVTGICNRYGFDAFLEMIPVWLGEEGGSAAVRGGKEKGKWAFANFVRDVEELLEAKKSGTLDQVANDSEDRTAPANRRPAVQI